MHKINRYLLTFESGTRRRSEFTVSSSRRDFPSVRWESRESKVQPARQKFPVAVGSCCNGREDQVPRESPGTGYVAPTYLFGPVAYLAGTIVSMQVGLHQNAIKFYPSSGSARVGGEHVFHAHSFFFRFTRTPFVPFDFRLFNTRKFSRVFIVYLLRK